MRRPWPGSPEQNLVRRLKGLEIARGEVFLKIAWERVFSSFFPYCG
jgi:hypothetical protein